MTLTIEKPETEARLIRFATSRGISPLEALDELLDEVKQDAIPELLITPEFADELQAMCEGIEAGTIKVTPWDSEAHQNVLPNCSSESSGTRPTQAASDVLKGRDSGNEDSQAARS